MSTVDKEVRIGILGSGFVCNFYMQGLQLVPGQRVTGVYSRTIPEAQPFAEKWNIPFFTDNLDEFADRDDIDLYAIGLANQVHAKAAITLAKRGRNVLVTKPMACNASEALEMLAAVEDNKVFHGYLEPEVFIPAMVKAKEMIDAGMFGKVHMVRGREAHFGSHTRANWDPNICGGGPLLTTACHPISGARYLLDKKRVVRVFGWGAKLVHKQEKIEDNDLLLMEFEDGSIGQIEASWSTRGGMDLLTEIYGDQGRMSFNPSMAGAVIQAFTTGETGQGGYVAEKVDVATGWLRPIPGEAFAYGYTGQFAHMIDCYRNGRVPRETFLDGYVVNEIIDAGYRSMKAEKWVDVEYRH